ncbi:MAG: indole-3-glycerol phosphate synthase TrpC [Lachnospiraceae bacterium]|nr:indole-3-glycerol phosphate synthase TrpC [Lachnospiraceae bacterium]
MTILDEIAAKTKGRVAEAKRICPNPMMANGGKPVFRRMDLPRGVNTAGDFPFEKALRKPGLSFITEVKKASPSKGIIAESFPYAQIAEDYDNAGADCISCLTEPYWFMGSNKYLTEIKSRVNIPVLRKDFTVDDYMIYEAKAIGADAILLICAILDPVQLHDYQQLADELGLSAIVEAHSAEEIEMGLKAGARILGVNNRNLKDFTVDVTNAGNLRSLVPDDVLFISESGVRTREDILVAEQMRADAVLVGETMMRSENKSKKLRELSGRPPRVKICGMMTEEDIRKVNGLHPDYVGFVFAKTRHYISYEQAKKLKSMLDPSIQAVGVFVDTPVPEIIDLLREGIIDMAQLHGHETNEDIEEIRLETGKKVIKAVILKENDDIKKAADYPAADYLLFDAGKGSGRTFRWDLLKTYAGDKPYFLAGGLHPENVREGVLVTDPFAVDVSSGVEDTDLSKNYEKMKAFIAEV